MARRKTKEQLLQELEDKYSGLLAKSFFGAIAEITDSVVLDQFVTALEAKDFEKAIRALNLDNAAFSQIVTVLRSAFEETGMTIASTIPARIMPDGVTAKFRFDVRNNRAEQWLANQSSTLVTRIVEDTRTAVRLRLESGLIEGSNPRTTALDIVGRIDPVTKRRKGGIIGLNGPQEQWVRNARNELREQNPEQLQNYLTRKMRDKRFDTHVRKAINDEKPIPVNIQQKMIGRYHDNMLKLRGDTIGRSETIETLNRAQWESYTQSVEKGVVKTVLKKWDSAGKDGRTRDSHLALDEVAPVALDRPFISPVTGDGMLFPGDRSLGASGEDTVNCRCRVRYVIDYFEGIK